MIAIYIVGLLFLVLALSCGPLLPIWMFLNSLQLIAHLPLLRVSLPGQANIIMLDYLNVVRLHIGGLNKALGQLLNLGNDQSDYLAATDDDSSYYNELLMSSNYHTSLARNLIFIAILFVVIALLWLFYAAISL